MKIKKLNLKGFSHVELLVIIVAVVAISSVGYYVAKHKNTSHAGSYTLLASQGNSKITGSVYACVSKVSSTQWVIKGLATVSPKVPSTKGYIASLFISSSSTGSSGVAGVQFYAWTKTDTATARATINPTHSNYIGGTITVPVATHGGGGGYVNAKSLANC